MSSADNWREGGINIIRLLSWKSGVKIVCGTNKAHQQSLIDSQGVFLLG